MGHPAVLNFARLRTPPEHGDVLIEPPVDRLLALAESNHALLRSYSFTVLDRGVADVRAELRKVLCAGCDQPAVITGHQPEFIHAGVWAKHVVADRLARRLGGKAINLVVDSDAPKSAYLDVPTWVEGRVTSQTVPWANVRAGTPYEHIESMDERACAESASHVQRLMGDRFDRSCMPEFLDVLRRNARLRDWVDQMVVARREIERRFGVELIEHRVSRVWFGPLLADLICNADRFAACYNAALATYRVAHKVRGPDRPIPDLIRTSERCEVPVWVYQPSGPRRRLFVERVVGALRLFAGEQLFVEIPESDFKFWESARAALNQSSGYVFRPRALSLTIWARVLVGDLFIHGIGGAKYDRITDDIIRRYLGVEPPAMGCVSATLMIDDPPQGVKDDTVGAARARLRDVQHNPQRHVRRNGETQALITQRDDAVADSMRLRAEAPRDRARRRAAFERIRRLNVALIDADPEIVTRANENLAAVERRQHEIRQARRRDYFFAMMDQASLRRLRDTLASAATKSAADADRSQPAPTRRNL